jgi:rhodanese-related sulfurtransferase
MKPSIGSQSRSRGSALSQALIIVLLGSFVGVAADLLLPRGVLRRTSEVLRDLDLFIPVHLWQPEAAAAAVQAGEIFLIDGRPSKAFKEAHPAGALSLSLDTFGEEELPDDLLAELSGGELVVILSVQDFEDARFYAQELAAEFGAVKTGTLEGGFEAWEAAGLPLEGQQSP